MFGNRKLAKGTAILPALAGLAVLMLVAVLFGPSGSIAGAEFYDITAVDGNVEKGYYEGALEKGYFAAPGDLINITAANQTDGSVGDRIVVDVIVLDSEDDEVYRVSWALNYSGDSNIFSGYITMEVDMTSNFTYVTSGDIGIKLNVSDGYNITINKHISPYDLFYYFHVDAAGPEYKITNPANDVVSAGGVYYAKPDTEIQLEVMDNDILADDIWFMTEPNTNYTLDGISYTNWTGENITLPTQKGSYHLTVNATDRFGHYIVRSWEYVISEFLDSTYYVANTVRTLHRPILGVCDQ
jgi:hypothetical protein